MNELNTVIEYQSLVNILFGVHSVLTDIPGDQHFTGQCAYPGEVSSERSVNSGGRLSLKVRLIVGILHQITEVLVANAPILCCTDTVKKKLTYTIQLFVCLYTHTRIHSTDIHLRDYDDG